jgi:hypothetical protein
MPELDLFAGWDFPAASGVQEYGDGDSGTEDENEETALPMESLLQPERPLFRLVVVATVAL